MLASFVGVTITPCKSFLLIVKFVLILGVTIAFETMHVAILLSMHQIYSMQCTHKACSIQLCSTNNEKACTFYIQPNLKYENILPYPF